MAEMAAREGAPKHRHRVLVWSLIVLASVLLIVSITANWVQREALDTNQVVNTTDEILKDQDVQQALSIYLVDQLYANVDVQGAIEAELPSTAQGAGRPAHGGDEAARPGRLAEGARLASRPEPSSQRRRPAHKQFVKPDHEQEQVRLDHRRRSHARIRKPSSPTWPLASGWTSATISEIQGVVQSFSKDLKAAPDHGPGTRSSRCAQNSPRCKEGSLSPQTGTGSDRRSRPS